MFKIRMEIYPLISKNPQVFNTTNVPVTCSFKVLYIYINVSAFFQKNDSSSNVEFYEIGTLHQSGMELTSDFNRSEIFLRSNGRKCFGADGKRKAL